MPATPVFLLVVESDAPVEFARLVELAETGWRHGVHVLWVAPDVAQLPSACRTFTDVRRAPEGDVGYLRTGDLVSPVALETIGADAASRADPVRVWRTALRSWIGCAVLLPACCRLRSKAAVNTRAFKRASSRAPTRTSTQPRTASSAATSR